MKLTKKQKILLDFVAEFSKEHDYSPTFREIMYALGYKSVSTVAKHIDNLVILGYIVKRDGEARSLEVAHPYVVGSDADDTTAHRQWLSSQIREKLRSPDMPDEDKELLKRVYELFAIDGVL